MRKLRKIMACLLLLITALVPMTVVSADTTLYTYNYDFFGIQQEAPDAYTAEDLLLG